MQFYGATSQNPREGTQGYLEPWYVELRHLFLSRTNGGLLRRLQF